jgi:hypothetical protein
VTGDTDTRAAGGTPTECAGRRVAVAWVLVVVAASLVDPAAVLALVGASPTAGTGGAGGAAAFVAAHLVAYGVLAWLLVDGLAPNADGLGAVVAAVAVAAAVGVGVELLQAPVAARTASAADALVNTVGATVGAGVHAALGGRRRQ